MKGLVIVYGINAAQNAMMQCRDHFISHLGISKHNLTNSAADEWKNDPRNVAAKNKV